MSINRILNISFSISKVVSVIMAFVLLVALVGGIVMFSSTLFSGGTDYESFEESFAKAANMDAGSTGEDAGDTFKGTNERLAVETEYGKDLQAAIKAAQCPDPTGTYNVLVGNGLSASSRSKYFGFVEKYFYDFAEAAIKNPALNREFFCGENILDVISRHDAEEAAGAMQRMYLLGGSIAVIIGTILLIFILMVIPAIYRIEEHLRPTSPTGKPQ